MSLIELLGDNAWLFDLGFDVPYLDRRIEGAPKLNWSLPDEYLLPNLRPISTSYELGMTTRMAWHETGLYLQWDFEDVIAGKKRNEELVINIMVLLDTRSSPGVHRATAYCHCFDYLVRCEKDEIGPLSKPPYSEMRPIPRSRANPPPVMGRFLPALFELGREGASMKVVLPTDNLYGFDPVEFPEIGIMFFVLHRYVGRTCLARLEDTFPMDDPSLWCRATLVR